MNCDALAFRVRKIIETGEYTIKGIAQRLNKEKYLNKNDWEPRRLYCVVSALRRQGYIESIPYQQSEMAVKSRMQSFLPATKVYRFIKKEEF